VQHFGKLFREFEHFQRDIDADDRACRPNTHQRRMCKQREWRN
jgi:hypothetical protein